MIIERIKAKTPIRRGSVDSWWWCEASINPYLGCYHDCTYCDGKAEGYYMHEDFGTRIKGKINAPQVLEQFFRKLKFSKSTLVDYLPAKGFIVPKSLGKFIIGIGGGVCDVYQPAERKLKITQQLLQVVHDYSFPVFLLTKNKSVLRDLELLKKINSSNYANVGFSITLTDEEDQKNFEPRASTTQERLTAIRMLRNQGIHAGVLFLPVLPWIGDTEENMHELFRKAKKAHAEYVLVGGLTLKPGRNKREFLSQLKENYPTLLTQYSRLYGNNNKWGNFDHQIAKEYNLKNPIALGFDLGKQYGIPTRMPRYIPEGRIKGNLRISTILFRIAFLKKFHPPVWVRTGDFEKAAYLIDCFPKDLQEISSAEIDALPVSKRVLSIIKEVVSTGSCEYLDKIGESKYLFY
ncbi:MAG: hypothetical protein EAX86_06240 [Candidatus Heimdallarchaeota archaeon]|nr:hypothetical protein [Candidatus Heimdallarchaeota archaeon]